jgi:hypothetical protein
MTFSSGKVATRPILASCSPDQARCDNVPDGRRDGQAEPIGLAFGASS